jgi:hypothetical protein
MRCDQDGHLPAGLTIDAAIPLQLMQLLAIERVVGRGECGGAIWNWAEALP